MVHKLLEFLGNIFKDNLLLLLELVWYALVGLGGLGVMCSPRDPRFVSSNPAEVDGFFQDVKILSTSPPRGTLSWDSLKNLKPEKIGLWAKFNRHIHVLIAKFGERNRSYKGDSALGSNDHPINTIQYKYNNESINVGIFYVLQIARE